MQTVISSEQSPPSHAPQLPDEPLFVIEARKLNIHFAVKDWWTYRELLYFLIWRDVKIRYKQTLLGAAWALIQPLLTMLILTFIFSRVARIDSEGVPYPVFALAALLPWTFFANAITTSGNSIVGSAHVITKVYFPRMIIPVASVCASLIDLAIAFPMLFGLMIYYRIGLTANFILLIPLLLLTMLLAIAVGTWLSALNVKYRDVKFAIPFLVQIWMFVSPVAYPASVVPGKWKLLYFLNPLAGIIGGYRAALFGQSPNWKSIGIATAVTTGLLIYSTLQFRKMERTFADIV
jgi:homopolymeric O-antigen transport system permease protein